MKILFFCHWSFFREAAEMRSWIDAFSAELIQSGHTVDYFHPMTHKIHHYDVVHVFSFQDFETWVSLRKLGANLVVTPVSQAGKVIPSYDWMHQFLDWGIHLCKGLFQRKWPPVDEITWMKQPQMFLVYDLEWQYYLSRKAGVPVGQIQLLSTNPQIAAREVQPVYQNLLKDGKSK